MTNKILSVVDNDELGECLSGNGLSEIDKFTWDKAAERIIGIYAQLLNKKLQI